MHPRDPAAPTLGGIQTFLGDFIKFAPDDFRISFVGLSHDVRARPIGRWQEIEVHGRRISFLAVGGRGGVPWSPVALARSVVGLARLWRALAVPGRILQVHRPYRQFLFRRHRGPAVQFIHLDLRDWPGPSGWPKLRRLYRDFSDDVLERMERVFIVNEFGAEQLRDEHPGIADRVEFLPVWYDEALFHPVDDGQRATLRTQMVARHGPGLMSVADRFIVLAVRLTEIKRPLLAIDTLAALLPRVPNLRLLVAGTGELRGAVEARAEELGVRAHVHLLGDLPRDELARLMQAADALLLTARSEGGGPRVVVEALACGLPVVSTPVGEAGRTVTTRRNGWLVDEATPEALAEGLEWAIGQPRHEVVAAATAAAAPFTAQAVLAGLYEAYRAIARDATRYSAKG